MYPDTLALLKQLVQNACVNDFTPGSGQEVRNADTIEEFFADVDTHVDIRRFEPEPGRVSLVVTVAGTDEAPPLTFLGHTDVVPVDVAQWTTPPFDAVVDGGKIFGRGTVDMLFLTATMAEVTREVARRKARGEKPKGTLQFVALADEEARGGLGAKWIAHNHPSAVNWENCLSETGGSHIIGTGGEDSVIVYVGEKGAAQRRLHVTGDPGHGSAPYAKDHAVVKIAEVARRIAQAQPTITDSEIWRGFVHAFRFDPDTEQQVLSGENYAALGTLAAYGDAVSKLTISPTVLRAGQAINVLPSHAWLELDIRTLPGQTQDDVDAVLIDALGELAEHVTIERLICEDATISPTDSLLYRAIENTLHGLFPDAAVLPMIAAGGSDLRFARAQGGTGYGFAAHAKERTLGEMHAQLHSHDEYLHLEDLDLTITAYWELTRAWMY
ncbi:MAG: M20/M25/M40 family metallo-hydrolase [Corynebacterium sp.]|uniref:M20/M25/M40 family metallo-hydrolase n=1 Tax=Corynebacterium sp. TaxID=1720 RepID=UPI0026DB5A26|nr:M20/M25/M40 family metallo-hydrolase [Corynebacterium sp.]MDO4761784.1 M20/M25/M40 family metallo-hydrolase [Corynebacterium sp.]